MTQFYERLKVFCQQNDIVLVSRECRTSETKFMIKSKICGHDKEILWVNLKKFSGIDYCLNCNPLAKLTYEKIVKVFEDKGCKLITTKEDFINNKMYIDSVFEYTTTCGHTSSIRLSHFKNDGQGLLCQDCNKVTAREKAIEKTKDDNMLCQKVELDGYNILKKTIEDSFVVERTYEGCLADVAIKPNDSESDLYLPVQLKATSGKGSQNRYIFTLNNDYKDLVLCCISNNDKRIWIFDFDNIPKTSTVGISKATEKSKSKYDTFEVDEESVINKLLDLYKQYPNKLQTKNAVMTPLADTARKELKYRFLREEKLINFDFKYPEIQCSVTDFTINDFKVQEKVLITSKSDSMTAHLSKAAGKNKARSPYEENDNDFYWYHIPNTTTFYIIPQDVLIKDGYIKSETDNGKTKMLLYPKFSREEAKAKGYNTAEYNQYIYDYERDVEKIKSVFGL